MLASTTYREVAMIMIALALTSVAFGQTPQPAPPVTPNGIRDYLLAHSPWVKPDKTVDTIKIGDPDKPVHKAGVCWYPSIENIRAAHDAGCDLLVCHEPTFWEHQAAEPTWRNKAPGAAKREFLEQTGMTILRAHDTWDQWPEIGIRDAWARFLGLDKRVYASTADNYYGVYEVPKQTLREFARYVAGKVKPIGEDSVRVMGDPERAVSRPAVGVGCAVPDTECVEAGADVLIVCYDGASYWAQRERMHELGAAVIVVEHGTSEIPGIMALRDHLAEKFPQIEFIYLAEHCRPWTATE